MKKDNKQGSQESRFIQCGTCGNDKFRAATTAVEILRFPKDDPTIFDNVTSQDHSIDHIACNQCGEGLDLDDIGFYG